VKVGNNGIEVRLLQFADDILFIYQSKCQNIVVIKSILICF